jgi:histidinol-phosphatase (PHP family)
MRVDLHNHTTRCNHASGTTEEYIQRAIEIGIDVYGFSDHAPCKNGFDPKYRMDISECGDYESDVKYVQEKYKDKIDILLGYEVDFLKGDFLHDRVLTADVDYIIGSVHFIPETDPKYSLFNHNFWGFDNPEFIEQYESKDVNKIWEDYFEAMGAMASSGKFDIVGHMDLIKVFGFLPTKDLRAVYEKTLKAIKKSNMVIELNAAGYRKPVKEQYPSQTILEMAYEMDIPITFGSDAHKVEDIGFNYEEITSLAKEIGYTKCVSFKKRSKIFQTF